MNPFSSGVSELTLNLELFKSAFTIDQDRHKYMRWDNTNFDSYLCERSRHQIITMSHLIYCGKPQTEKHEVKYPKGWWNAFKAEHPRLCKWLSPPQFNTVKVEWTGKVAFPELTALGEQSRYKTVVIWNQPSIEEF